MNNTSYNIVFSPTQSPPAGSSTEVIANMAFLKVLIQLVISQVVYQVMTILQSPTVRQRLWQVWKWVVKSVAKRLFRYYIGHRMRQWVGEDDRTLECAWQLCWMLAEPAIMWLATKPIQLPILVITTIVQLLGMDAWLTATWPMATSLMATWLVGNLTAD